MAISCNEMSGQLLCMCNPPTWTNNGYPQVYDSIYLAAEACGGASVKPPISDNLPNKKNRRKTKTKYLNMNHSQNSNCNAFNNRRMFDEFNGFTGYSQGSFDHTRDRDIDWLSARGTSGGACPPNTIPCATGCCPASSPQPARQTAGGLCPSGCSPCHNGVGCCIDGASTTPCNNAARQVRPTGGTAPARAVAGDDKCDQPKCGKMGTIYRRCRKEGCTCTDMTTSNGQCVSSKSRRGKKALAQQRKMGLVDASGRKVYLTPQQVQQRESGYEGGGCGGACGVNIGGCDNLNGCYCNSDYNGECVSAKVLGNQGAAMSTNFAGQGRSFYNGGMRLR